MSAIAHARPPAATSPPLVLVALACIASLVVGSAATLVVASELATGTTSVHDAHRTELVRRFYAGVNETLRTGDTSALTTLLAPNFVAHPAPSGLPMGRDGLTETLMALRAMSPGATLLVESVHPAGDHVAARIVVAGGERKATLGLPLDDDPLVWLSPDLFRVRDGEIVELWGGPQSGVLASPRAEFRVVLAGESDQDVRLSHRRYEPKARQEGEQAPGPMALVGEHGTLTVAIEAGGEGTGEAGRVTSLAPNQALVLAAGTRFTTSNDERVPAEVLIMALSPWQDVRTWAPAPANAAGVETETVAWGVAHALPPAVVVRVGDVTLAPGAGIPLHVVAGMELLLVESSALSLIADEPVWVVRGLTQGTRVSRATALDPRESVIVPAYASVTYRNAGTEPVRLLVVTIQAEQPPGPHS